MDGSRTFVGADSHTAQASGPIRARLDKTGAAHVDGDATEGYFGAIARFSRGHTSRSVGHPVAGS